jgi:hypothetical protein
LRYTDAFGGYTLEVQQVSWGHVARKRTWLYFVGIDPKLVMGGIRTGGTPTAWCSGTYTPGQPGTVPAGIRVATALERRATPPAFAEWLVALARTSSLGASHGQ